MASRSSTSSATGRDDSPQLAVPEYDYEKNGNASQELEYLYLELDTTLPTPWITAPPGPGQSPAPEAPNLDKYISPFLWPKWRKSLMTWISCAVTALAGYSAGEISPASGPLTDEWDISAVVYNLGITLFCIGFALAPMVLAPFSEINGRRPIFVASGVLFVACIVACGGTRVFGGFLVARFFQGVGACMIEHHTLTDLMRRKTY